MPRSFAFEVANVLSDAAFLTAFGKQVSRVRDDIVRDESSILELANSGGWKVASSSRSESSQVRWQEPFMKS